jgi:hypothetical protein
MPDQACQPRQHAEACVIAEYPAHAVPLRAYRPMASARGIFTASLFIRRGT